MHQVAGSRTLALGLTLVLGACTEPMYREDALDAGSAGGDAGSTPKPTCPPGEDCDAAQGPIDPPVVPNPRIATRLPDWAASLPGIYALRIRYHGRLPTGEQQTTQVVARATIGEDPTNKDVNMLVKLCEYTSEIRNPASSGTPQRMSIVHPGREPEELYPLKFNAEKKDWQTIREEPTRVGYRRFVACAAGTLTDKQSDQAWLDMKCKCAVDKGIPISAEDCRVNDPDGDQLPGMALRLSGPITGVDHVARSNSSNFVLGTVDPMGKQHEAKVKADEQMSQLQCDGRSCEPSRPNNYCYPADNPAYFERVADDYGCDEIMRDVAASKLLVEKMPRPAFPSDCPIRSVRPQPVQ